MFPTRSTIKWFERNLLHFGDNLIFLTLQNRELRIEFAA